MVKFTSALFVLASFVVAGFASPIEQRDIGKVRTDLSNIAQYVTSLDNAVSVISGDISIPAALSIQSIVQNVQKSLDQGTNDVRGVHGVSESDAKQILNSVGNFEPKVIHLLSSISTKRASFTHLPIPAVPLIKHALQSLFGSAGGFGSALVDAAPADVKGQAMDIKHAIDMAFQKAIAAYS
ncbi:hypothetical protein AX17_002259 [Amanita inopinata Kibby_2008]|nr:hypothetical protein AX17_002259 [Amanita inopinata Kibby_2008]